jgi:hypothetical protein
MQTLAQSFGSQTNNQAAQATVQASTNAAINQAQEGGWCWEERNSAARAARNSFQEI